MEFMIFKISSGRHSIYIEIEMTLFDIAESAIIYILLITIIDISFYEYFGCLNYYSI